MKMRRLLPLFVLALALLVTVGASSCNKQDNKESQTQEQEQANTQTETSAQKEEKASIVIDMGDGIYEGQFDVKDGMTAFDLLVEASTIHNLKLKTQEFDFGVMVDGIGEKVGGTDNKYWLFYLNGESAQQGADATVIKAGDKVEFRFEESTF